MDRVVNKFSNFAESNKTNRRYYLSLTPAERLDILLDLISTYRDNQNENAKGFERVYRIIKLDKR